MFYPDIKDGMSPSSFAQWMDQKSAFIKSYFIGERSPETAAMKSGTKIHALIEAGVFQAKHVYENAEQEISVLINEGLVFRGRPDSYGMTGESEVSFVDYKSGKANDWKEKLPKDLKMRSTALLVWDKAGRPDKVKAYIEYIETTWDPEQREVIPVDGKETEVVEITYTKEDMETIWKVIEREMKNVNEYYEKWKNGEDYVDMDDVNRYVELENAINKLKKEQDEIKANIMNQMSFGGIDSKKTDFGTFSISRRETFNYPENLTFKVGEENYSFGKFSEIEAAMEAAKTNFKLVNDPASVAPSIRFTPKRK